MQAAAIDVLCEDDRDIVRQVVGEEVAAGVYSHTKEASKKAQLAYALAVDLRFRVAVFFGAAGGGAVDLVMRPDLVLPRTVGRSTTAGACNH